MAPIKFEDDMRDTLEKRSIQPSKNAWNALSSKLDAQEKRNNRKSFWWFGIAASIVGIIWITTTVFNNNTEVITPVIVDTPTIIEETPIQQIEVETKTDAIQLITEEKVELESEEIKVVSISIIDKQEKAKKTNSIEEPKIAVQDENQTKILTEEEQKAEEVVAQIIELQSKNESVTDAEIDALLFKAQQEINMKNNAEVGTISVSAYTLLMDVEQELDPSFREKIFDLLKENYNTVKNAVAQRND